MDETSERMTRREMLRVLLGGGLAVGGACALRGLAGCARENADASDSSSGPHEAMFYENIGGDTVRCTLCPTQCVVRDGGRGLCGVRENRGGTYYTLVYGTAAALNIDPIEKKPLFHYLPGTRAFSLGTAGCNLHCKNCQNWEISQVRPEQVDRPIPLSPQTIIAKAREYGTASIAYTYNEPVIFYEYMRDTAQLARSNGLRSVMISNGYINRQPMLELAPHLDAVKVDLKGFTDSFYRDYCGGTIEPVKQTIKRIHALGKWLEIVYLVIPTLNDSMATIRQMSDWLKAAAGADVPLHFTRFMPCYQLKKLPPTPVSTLEACREVAMDRGLNYVYVGNVPGHEGENTYCAHCGKVVIRRHGYEILERNVTSGGACKFCGKQIPGVWS